MFRVRHVLAGIVLLFWATSTLLYYFPIEPAWLSLYLHLLPFVAPFVLAVGSLLLGKGRALGMFCLLLAVIVGGDIAAFTFRLNNVCSPDDRYIRSESDAIEIAKRKIVKNRYFSSDEFGSASDFVDSLARTGDCCSAVRYRTIFLVIVWEVTLRTGDIHARDSRLVEVLLSNCGKIFEHESHIDPHGG